MLLIDQRRGAISQFASKLLPECQLMAYGGDPKFASAIPKMIHL